MDIENNLGRFAGDSGPYASVLLKEPQEYATLLPCFDG